MSWTDRMKKTLDTFKRMALPLYGFYALFAFIGIVVAVIFVGAILIPYFSTDGLGPSLSPAPYMDPNIPVPPGYGFDSSQHYGFGYFNEFAPYMDMIPALLQSMGLFMLVSLVGASIFQAGIFNLTKKAYVEKAKFRDIRLKGFLRVLVWYGIMGLLGIVLIGLGVLIGINIHSEYGALSFALVYLLVLIALGIFLAPWVYSAPCFMLNHPEFSFGQAFKESWRFYRYRHMGALWGAFLTILGIQLIFNAINRISPDIGLLISVLIAPFVAILPIVWVFTLEDEEQEQKAYGYEVNVNPVSTTQPEATAGAPAATPYTPVAPTNPAPPPPSTPPHTPPSPTDPVHRAPDTTSDPSSSFLYTPPENPYSTPEHPAYDPYKTPPCDNPSVEQEKGIVNFCPTCGRKVREGASYCSQCGTKL